MFINDRKMKGIILYLTAALLIVGLWNNSANQFMKKESPLHENDLRFKHIEEFFDYIEYANGPCKNYRYFGGNPKYLYQPSHDGDKVVCFDEVFDIKPQDCLVYSFGINNEWSFDDAFAKFGCQVNAFDPSMNIGDHKRGDRIHFYRIGISDKDEEKKVRNKLFKLKKFTSILEKLGDLKDDLVIDYLKIDVEGAEIPFLEDMLKNEKKILKKIKQIGMEIHPGKYQPKREHSFQKIYKLIKQLEQFGFQLFSSRLNTVKHNPYFLHDINRNVSQCYELVFGIWPDSS